MTRQVRALGGFLLLCYTLLFIQTNRLTVFQAGELQDDSRNQLKIAREFSGPRGDVVTADGVVIARSVPSDDQYKRQREYPEGDLFAHVTGYYSLRVGTAGVEKTYNDELAGETLDFDLRRLTDLFVDQEHVGNLTLSLRADVQRVAKEQLGDRKGSVVALDPRNGEIIALWSYPSYDPNPLADHDFEQASEVATLLDVNPDKPRLARTYQENFPPGSTFKVVTAAAGIEKGTVQRDSPDYPQMSEYLAGAGRPLPNFGGATCGGTFLQILQVSCNTAFAQMGVESVGADSMIATAEAFGFNQGIPIDLPNPARSQFPTEFENSEQFLAYSAIGQYEVRATPLEMALVAAAVANDGRIMTPHVMREVRDDEGRVVDSYDPKVLSTPMSAETATLLREGMISVVTDGTARNLATGLDGYVVGGKTGTAQLGTTPPRSHAWIIGFAGPPDETPHVAIAVIVEGQEGASEQTGGRVAAPIAAAVLGAALTPPTPAAGQDGGDTPGG